MIRKILVITILLAGTVVVSSQELSDFLDRVSRNNPEIQAYSRLLDARKAEARTGLTPPDPFLSGGYLPGNTSEAGTKTIWSVSQSFAFPTRYLLQKKINRNTIILAELEFSLGRMNILLEAKLAFFDLIYNKRSLGLLRMRKESYNVLQSVWKTMLENGETTIMDYNRIMLELSSLNLEITRKEAEVNMLTQRLQYLSGYSGDPPGEIQYPAESVTDADRILNEKSMMHPAWQIPETEYIISIQEVKLSRAGSLPEFEIGYESELVPGEKYAGPVGGISIPLWSNSNKARAASAKSEHSAALRDAALLKLNSDVRKEFSNYEALQKSIEEIKSIIESAGGKKYPDTALSSGEISVTTYFSYLEVIYDSENRLLSLENEYHKSLAVLLDHELAE